MGSRASQSRESLAPPVDNATQAVMIVANGYLLRHYSTSLMGGSPRRMPSSPGHFWEVPILFTSPGYGDVGEVGVVTVDAHTGQVVDGTPKPQVKAAMQRLNQEKQDALEAAFLRAKST